MRYDIEKLKGCPARTKAVGDKAMPPDARGAPSGNSDCSVPGVDIAIWWLDARRLRESVFGTEEFSDADWAIMLDLYGSGAVGKTIQVTDLPAMTGLASSTAGRHLRQLVASGWAMRTKDQNDRRRTLIALTDRGWDFMMLYFSELITKMNRPPRDHI